MASERTRRRRPRPRVGEGGRRLHSAASAIAVSVGAIVAAAFLNAPGLHKSAQIQDEGWKRHVALAVAEPLHDVSRALLLDRPRRMLKSALGRSSDDEIDTGVVVPAPQPQRPATGTPPRRERFTPDRPLRIWVAGDSLVVVPGESLLRTVARRSELRAAGPVDGRIASGLTRPDVFNWFTHVRDELRAREPHAVVVLFGANDDHGFMTGLPEGATAGAFGSDRWQAEYRRRVAGMMERVTRSGAFLAWIGLPVARDSERTRRYDTINAIVQSEAQKRRGRVAYLDTYFFFAGPDGGYAQYVDDGVGRLVKMRADDGVHFERAAGELIAGKVLALLDERFDLRGGG